MPESTCITATDWYRTRKRNPVLEAGSCVERDENSDKIYDRRKPMIIFRSRNLCILFKRLAIPAITGASFQLTFPAQWLAEICPHEIHHHSGCMDINGSSSISSIRLPGGDDGGCTISSFCFSCFRRKDQTSRNKTRGLFVPHRDFRSCKQPKTIRLYIIPRLL